MSEAPPPLQLNDAVIASSSHGDMEGVVAFTGCVDFESGDDWVGVRLTGKSVGQGRNDGSVQGTRYFECPEKCGIFVRANAVRKRTLTRLEELRLRRELASGGSAAAATAATTVTSNTGSSGTRTPPRSTTTASASATETTSAKSKLEELRQRRAALKAKQESTATSSSAGAGAATTAAARAPSTTSSSPPSRSTSLVQEVDDLKKQIQELTQQLQDEKDRAASVTEKLAGVEKESIEQKTKITELQTSLQEASSKAAAAAAATMPAAAETPTKGLLAQAADAQQQQNLKLEREKDELTDRLDDALREITNLRNDLQQQKQSHETALDQLTRARAEAASYQNQLQAVAEQSDQRVSTDAAHYKERAKLQADASALARRVEQLEGEKLELEASVEDVTLDKEQLQEEKEALEDKYEELKLDAETAQMEVEELKIELEDAKAAAVRATGLSETLTGAAIVSAGAGSSADSTTTTSPSKQQRDDNHADMVQALQVQNARLREALIRLREQSALEKMELTRELRTAEKDAQANSAVSQELDDLRTTKQILEEQIDDLKDMVEQGSAFEGMVEDLSDRVLMLEEENLGLQSVIREMEEAAELTAEMEEVQADELKAFAFDLEGRDTIIRNLEEAIKMQRRREDDFRRTVGNYKTTVDTLKQEKKALLEMQEGGEGEKSSLIASSQKALSRAAQLVADAAEMRKREAQAVVDRIDREIYQHLSTRLEDLLPHSAVSAEIAAIKGEIMTSKVVGKASRSLEGIGASFRKNIRPPLPQAAPGEAAVSGVLDDLALSDELKQQISTMMNQTEFAHVISEVSSDLLRFLTAGQWPEVLSTEASTELGAILGHTIPSLDSMLGVILKTLKEEGCLTVEQSNIGELRLSIQNTFQNVRTEVEREDDPIVSPSWKPPGWQLLKDSSRAKFSCLGAAAALSLAVDAQPESSGGSLLALNSLYNRVEQCSSQAVNVCLRLAMLDLKNEKLLDTLSEELSHLATEAEALLNAVKDLLTAGGNLESCQAAVEATLRTLAKASSVLRAENLAPNENDRHHPISPETVDAWYGVSSTARAVRSIDGDSEDVNYLLRAHAIEQRLGDAVEKEPLLASAQAKVASLEKTLSSRSKEIAMQNARLSELEKLVAKSSSTPIGGRGKNFDFASSDEYNNLKEENRVLTEAMDVMQREIEMYENEIRALKDFKSPKKGKGTPRRSASDIGSPNPRGAVEDPQNVSALEATLFRPALQQALQETARWKASATATAIMNLPPLPSLRPITSLSEQDASSDDWIRLSAAVASARLEKASLTLVNLTNASKSPRAQLRELKAKSAAADQRLESIVIQCRGRMQ